jgi:hypothetical protein
VTTEPAIPPREALADVRLRAPTRGNRRLERLLDAVNADEQVKACSARCWSPPMRSPIARIDAEHEQRLLQVFKI